MNLSSKRKNILPIWSVALVLFTVTAVASAQQHKNAPAPAAPRAAAPNRPAQAPHAAPAQHPGGNPNAAQRPGGANANNRGPGGANNPNNRGGANNANNRPGGANNPNNRGGANNANNRPGGANANNRGPGGANNPNNRGGANNANNRGGANNANNRGGANNANNRGQAGANNRGQAGANRPGGANANNRAPGGANRHQPAGSRQVALKSGGHATLRKDGKVRSIQTAHGMRIDHGMRGERRVVAQRNGRQVVAMGRHGGYSQRAYYRNGNRAYVQRTYYVNGQSYAYAYRTTYYGGYPYYGYAPAYYYGPAYYGWAYNPWPQPVYYNWGWAGQPWYGYYGPYYQPYPAYPYASLWLTDYLISVNLQAAYAAAEQGALAPRQFGPESSDMFASLWSSDPLVAASLAAGYGSGSYLFAPAAAVKGSGTQLSPEVKQAIADQIKKEIAAEKDAAANKGKEKDAAGDEVPAALDPNTRYFVVSSSLDLTTSNGDECALTQGDVIYRTGDTPDDDKMVDATVKASKKDECAIGATVGVEVSDLQDMHNALRQTMDEGLKKLAENSGKNGLPTAPDTKTTAGEVPPPAPDSNVADDLQQTQKDADQAEAEVQQSN